MISSFVQGMDGYARAALVGVSIFLIAAVIVMVTILNVEPDEAVFGLFLLVPAIVAVALLRFVRRWGLIVVALLSAFGILAFSADAGLMLTTPKSFFDFMLTLFTLAGLGISVVACLIGTIQYFRGAVGTDVSPVVMMTLRGIAGVVFVAAGISLVLTVINATGSVSAEDKAGAPEVVAKHGEWSVEILEATAGQPIRILVKNDDPILHTFTIKDSSRGIDIDVRVGPWAEELIEIEALEAGAYGFICRVEGHEEDMTGVLNVR